MTTAELKGLVSSHRNRRFNLGQMRLAKALATGS